MTSILLIISILLLSIYCLLLIYYCIGWAAVPNYSPLNPKPIVSITIIIPARNEEKNLPGLLDSIEHQTYSKEFFQVLVIDDHSTDNTANIASQYPFVTCLSLKDFIGNDSLNSYKKKAIEIGIENSVGELIVTTDADCIVPKRWLETIAAFYLEKKAAFIVMPVAINCSAKPIEIFQALDFMSLQGVTAASVHKKMHSMCNGANLAYSRHAFEAVNGFYGIDNIASGDDMLLMHKIALQYPDAVHYLKSKNVIVHTEPVHSIKAFFNQRIRWASKADKYDDKRIIAVLLLIYLLNVLLLVMPVLSVVSGQWSVFACSILLIAIKTIIELIFLYPVAKFFGKQALLWAFPLAQPFHIIYTVIAGWLGKFGSYQWKERKVQ
ncbi:MAG: glycosyltransferase [Chitinophagaceae bacterium]|nr:MAG: glycosyltransferase [Chitinophagaceae bacterium]